MAAPWTRPMRDEPARWGEGAGDVQQTRPPISRLLPVRGWRQRVVAVHVAQWCDQGRAGSSVSGSHAPARPVPWLRRQRACRPPLWPQCAVEGPAAHGQLGPPARHRPIAPSPSHTSTRRTAFQASNGLPPAREQVSRGPGGGQQCEYAQTMISTQPHRLADLPGPGRHRDWPEPEIAPGDFTRRIRRPARRVRWQVRRPQISRIISASPRAPCSRSAAVAQRGLAAHRRYDRRRMV